MSKRKLLLASNNPKKIKELKQLLETEFEILSLADLNITEEIPETENTFEGNALLKAKYLAKKYKTDVIADDSGLMVDVLNGEPGVYSARYAGEPCNDQNNMDKLLKKLGNEEKRAAKFVTSIALIQNGLEYIFNGQVKGTITHNKRGTNGFGYDPIFVPSGYDKTFAELDSSIKQAISHRAEAVNELRDFLLR